MKIKVGCGIGYHGATHEMEYDIEDDELEGKTKDEIDEYILEEYAIPFANEHLEIWWNKQE